MVDDSSNEQEDFENKIAWERFQQDIDKDVYDADWQQYKYEHLSEYEKQDLDLKLKQLQIAVDAQDADATESIVRGIVGGGLLAAAIFASPALAPILVAGAVGAWDAGG